MHDVRCATAGDWPAVELLYGDARRNATWLAPSACRKHKFAEVSQDERLYVVKTSTGELAAFISVYAPMSFVHHLFVAPKFQRQGLASSLLLSLRSWLPFPWRLKCVQANTQALSFYASQGWQVVAAGESEDGRYSVLEFNESPGPGH